MHARPEVRPRDGPRLASMGRECVMIRVAQRVADRGIKIKRRRDTCRVRKTQREDHARTVARKVKVPPPPPSHALCFFFSSSSSFLVIEHRGLDRKRIREEVSRVSRSCSFLFPSPNDNEPGSPYRRILRAGGKREGEKKRRKHKRTGKR